MGIHFLSKIKRDQACQDSIVLPIIIVPAQINYESIRVMLWPFCSRKIPNSLPSYHLSGEFECKWRECGSRVSGQTTDFNRHVYFHAFHVKIKNVGTAVVEKSKLTPCQMDGQSRNLIPELPERLHCGWSMCEVGVAKWKIARKKTLQCSICLGDKLNAFSICHFCAATNIY